MPVLPIPPPTRDGAVAWVAEHLGDLLDPEHGPVRGSERFTGGQTAADAALDAYDVTGYARTRSAVDPPEARGASALSPYVRHGLLPLPRLWAHVGGGPAQDVRRFRDELLWQEYARHLYGRLGGAMAAPLRYGQPRSRAGWDREPLPRDMACLDLVRTELEVDGWLVNPMRLWTAGHWVLRAGRGWEQGEDWLYRQLLDGSRAANRLGWQWAAGTATGKPYAFSQWQVQKRAPSLCRRCPLRRDCPIEAWPSVDDPARLHEPDPLLRADPDPAATAGPRTAEVDPAAGEPRAVWLHGESMDLEDPALAAHPELPVVWVWDEPLLARLRLSPLRLVFLTETLAGVRAERELVVRRGDVAAELAGHGPVAVTYAPVPGWRTRAVRVRPAVVHPWPWLRRPHGGPVASYSSWVRVRST